MCSAGARLEAKLNKHSHMKGQLGGLSAKGKLLKKKQPESARECSVWSRYFSVCWKTKLLKQCWSIAVRFRDESYITMCQIYESTNKSFLLNCIFALLSFGLVFNGCVTVSLKKKAKPNNLHRVVSHKTHFLANTVVTPEGSRIPLELNLESSMELTYVWLTGFFHTILQSYKCHED